MHGHRARKRFSQNFLHDAHYIGRIVAAVAPQPGDRIVEIGPGLGALTAPLAAAAGQVSCVEIDRDLAARLRQRYPPDQLLLVEGDALEFDWAAFAAADPRPLKVVGNLPYHISSPLLFVLLPIAHRVQSQHFMLQKEVVDRMAAQPGTKDYGRLSVMLQWRYDVEALFDVPPEAFDPPPCVMSAIVRMTPHAAPSITDPSLLEALVQVAFSQRRKLLRHSLGRWLQAQGYAGDFDLQRRAEEVPVAEFVALAQSL